MSSEFFNNAIYLDDVPEDHLRDYIGSGYRSFCYVTDHEKNGKIVLLGYDKQDNPKTFIFPWRSHVSYNVKYPTDELDVYNRYVATKTFKNKRERDNYVAGLTGATIVECMRPEQEAAHFLFDRDALKPDFNKQLMRLFSLDIETEISETFMKPSVAGNRINMITIHDSKTDEFFTWSLSHAEVDFKDFEETVEHFDIENAFKDAEGQDDIHFETLEHEKIDVKTFDINKVKNERKSILRVTHNALSDMPRDKFKFFEFHDDEYAMLQHFLDWWESNCPDIVYGWNVKAYDIPYIFRRIENTLGKDEAKRLSPIGRAFVKEVNHDNERADVAAEIEIVLPGVFIADGLVLYRDKFKIGGTLDGGFGLSNVGEHEELGRKVEYDGSLKDLYMQDYQKFYEYNVRDVDLCKRINDKCKMITLARQLVSFGLSDYNKIYGSIDYLIGSLVAFSRTQLEGKLFPSYVGEKKKIDGFEGALVLQTVPGVYRGGTGTIDFASLYPSNIRAINASPETYVGKILIYWKDEFGNLVKFRKFKKKKEDDYEFVGEFDCNEDDEYPFNPFDDEQCKRVAKLVLLKGGSIETRVPITVEQLRKLIETKCIWTANNTLFLKHEVRQGVVSKWCEVFYNLRKQNKKKMLACYHTLHDEEKMKTLSEAEIKKLELDEENYNTVQMGLKLSINSIYGVMGTGFSPIANKHMAQSVTRQGRMCNSEASAFILKRFRELYGMKEGYPIKVYDKVDSPVIDGVSIGGDTDSQFMDLQCVTDAIGKRLRIDKCFRDWPRDSKRVVWDEVSKFVDDEVNKYVRDLVHDYCHTNQQSVLSYELEYMTDCGIWESKKHYFIHKCFDEGDAVDKIKVTGIELKKNSVPKEMKVFLEDIYRGVVLKDWKQADYDTYVNQLYDRFSKFTVDEVSFWKGYNTGRETSGFLQMEKGCTGIAKSCQFYNQIIDKLGLGKKYEQIRLGDKVRQVYIKSSNKYGIDTIAFKDGQWPREFNDLFQIDYYKMFTKVILDPLKRFREACKFDNIDPSKQVVCDIFSF